MIRWGALSILLLGSVRTRSSELAYDYRDDHDGRVLAAVSARLEGRSLQIEVRPQGSAVEAPAGFRGFRGENYRTASELEQGLAEGRIVVTTTGSLSSRAEIAERGAFRERREERGRLVEGPGPSRLRSLVYRAELEPAEARRGFRTEFRVAGRLRLALDGWIDAGGGALVRFESRGAHGPIASPGQDPPEPVERLLRQLADDDPGVRRRAEARLVARGPAALPDLERRRDDPDPELRARIAQITVAIRRDDLLRTLAGPEVERRAEQLAALGRIAGRDVFEDLKERRDERFIPALTDLVLYELDADLRTKAEETLQAIGGPKVFPALLWTIRNREVHQEVPMQWLGAHGDPTLFAELERLEKAGSGVAKVALQQLRERFPGAKAEPPRDWAPIDEAALLRAAREGKTAAERIRGLRAIVTGMSADPEARGILEGALGDSEEEVRYRAAEALTFLPSRSAGPALDRLLRDGAQAMRVRQMSAVALGRAGAGAPLLAALGESPAELRVTIAGALGDTGDRRLLPALREREAKETDPEAKRALAGAAERLAGR